MPSTTNYELGDVVTVRFRFHDFERPKPRPAIIISVDEYHASRVDAVMMAVTGNRERDFFGDCPIMAWREAGLLMPSTAKGVFRTISRAKIQRRLGALTEVDRSRVRDSLRRILGL